MFASSKTKFPWELRRPIFLTEIFKLLENGIVCTLRAMLCLSVCLSVGLFVSQVKSSIVRRKSYSRKKREREKLGADFFSSSRGPMSGRWLQRGEEKTWSPDKKERKWELVATHTNLSLRTSHFLARSSLQNDIVSRIILRQKNIVNKLDRNVTR